MYAIRQYSSNDYCNDIFSIDPASSISVPTLRTSINRRVIAYPTTNISVSIISQPISFTMFPDVYAPSNSDQYD